MDKDNAFFFAFVFVLACIVVYLGIHAVVFVLLFAAELFGTT